MGTAEYVAVALANAHADALTSKQVKLLGYTEIAHLAGVILGPNGESPADFYYEQVRTAVVAALEVEEAEALVASQESDLKAATRIFPSLRGLGVYRIPQGHEVK